MRSAPTSREPHPLLAAAEWLRAPETRRVLAAVESEGSHARIVGGAVRNTLLGRPVSDIDIATDASPETVMRLARRAGLAAVPTGLDHGTVTVVADHHPFEVTTLRRDVETDGRHATVAFTSDWHADAARRDFTINALYCDANGVLFDFVDGLSDIERRRVRFIGDAHQRIREDYLRILRFFRFSAEYTGPPFDADGIAACVAESAGLARLSAERVRSELLKLLVAPAAATAMEVMTEAKLLEPIIGRAPEPAFARLVATAQHLREVLPAGGFSWGTSALPRLAALAGVRTAEDAVRLMERLRLSRREADQLGALARVAAALGRGSEATPSPQRLAAPPTDAVRTELYRNGINAGRDGLLLAWARSAAAPDDASWTGVCAAIADWTPPALPLSGRDIVARGVEPGQRVGETLRAFEDWWIAAGFPNDRAVLDAALSRLMVSNE